MKLFLKNCNTWSQSTNVTDGQTDGQTTYYDDTTLHYDSRGKNRIKIDHISYINYIPCCIVDMTWQSHCTNMPSPFVRRILVILLLRWAFFGFYLFADVLKLWLYVSLVHLRIHIRRNCAACQATEQPVAQDMLTGRILQFNTTI